ncbi:hypothetical protein Bbelb_363040 [Branchiostoma belcheri]|nr:hypothetical protein Bbelb_363040 [Branchiostoma belcheri]
MDSSERLNIKLSVKLMYEGFTTLVSLGDNSLVENEVKENIFDVASLLGLYDGLGTGVTDADRFVAGTEVVTVAVIPGDKVTAIDGVISLTSGISVVLKGRLVRVKSWADTAGLVISEDGATVVPLDVNADVGIAANELVGVEEIFSTSAAGVLVRLYELEMDAAETALIETGVATSAELAAVLVDRLVRIVVGITTSCEPDIVELGIISNGEDVERDSILVDCTAILLGSKVGETLAEIEESSKLFVDCTDVALGKKLVMLESVTEDDGPVVVCTVASFSDKVDKEFITELGVGVICADCTGV